NMPPTQTRADRMWRMIRTLMPASVARNRPMQAARRAAPAAARAAAPWRHTGRHWTAEREGRLAERKPLRARRHGAELLAHGFDRPRVAMPPDDRRPGLRRRIGRRRVLVLPDGEQPISRYRPILRAVRQPFAALDPALGRQVELPPFLVPRHPTLPEVIIAIHIGHGSDAVHGLVRPARLAAAAASRREHGAGSPRSQIGRSGVRTYRGAPRRSPRPTDARAARCRRGRRPWPGSAATARPSPGPARSARRPRRPAGSSSSPWHESAPGTRNRR